MGGWLGAAGPLGEINQPASGGSGGLVLGRLLIVSGE